MYRWLWIAVLCAWQVSSARAPAVWRLRPADGDVAMALTEGVYRVNWTGGGSALAEVRGRGVGNGQPVRLTAREEEYEADRWDGHLRLHVPPGSEVEIRPAPSAPVLYLIGDSTMAVQPLAPYRGWGEFLPGYFGPDLLIANYAVTGGTLPAFLAEGRWEKIARRLRPGDFVLLQMGHNDAKSTLPDGEAIFARHLAEIAAGTRARGAQLILATPPQRASFTATGTVERTHRGYPRLIREEAARGGAPLLELAGRSAAAWMTRGPERTRALFVPDDDTHFNGAGAEWVAREAAAAIRESSPALAAYLRPGSLY